jgi:hypothetical protein
MTAKALRARDEVQWQSSDGTAHGKVIKKVSKVISIKGRQVAASTSDPQYLVGTDEGKRGAIDSAR